MENISRLYDIPLLRAALHDSRFSVQVRENDSRWYYEKVTSTSSAGFNPYSRKLFINRKSSIFDWIESRYSNDRLHNEGDFLASEVFFLMHDYIHAWSVLFIQQSMPHFGFGRDRIKKSNLENFVFCHLLTEAAATVAVDYWFLSRINISKLCDLGSNIKTLTVSYHENNLEEFRKFNPELFVQSHNFFSNIANFYCTGEFEGFSLKDIKQSNILLSWLKHELSYGETQRKYTRQWLEYLSGQSLIQNPDSYAKAVICNRPWQKKLIKDLSIGLWKKTIDNIDVLKPIGSKRSFQYWKQENRLFMDFSFTNIQRCSPSQIEKLSQDPQKDNHFRWFFNQFVSMHDFSDFPSELFGVLMSIRERKDLKALICLFKKLKIRKISASHTSPKHEPLDIFFLP